jgi:hypothetical protein
MDGGREGGRENRGGEREEREEKNEKRMEIAERESAVARTRARERGVSPSLSSRAY